MKEKKEKKKNNGFYQYITIGLIIGLIFGFIVGVNTEEPNIEEVKEDIDPLVISEEMYIINENSLMTCNRACRSEFRRHYPNPNTMGVNNNMIYDCFNSCYHEEKRLIWLSLGD